LKKKKSKPVDYEDLLTEQMQEPVFRGLYYQYYTRIRLGLSLRQARRTAKITQKELAQRINKPVLYIREIERGDCIELTINECVQIGNVLNHTIKVDMVEID